ncbi:MAG: 4Fe-4S binding protein [Victivallales bacterium]|nr:4Fe-4S binding protein [Victivallales bacterium]
MRRLGNILRILRIVSATVFFSMMLMLFLHPHFAYIPAQPEFVQNVQLGPALLRVFTSELTLALASGALAVLVLTLLAGRVFCSCICPLGIFQDIVLFVRNKLKRRGGRYKYLPSFRRVRMLVLAGSVLCVAGGFILPVYIFEPFAFFGRMVNALFLPVAIFFNNLAVKLAGEGNWTGLNTLEYPSVPLAVLLFTLLMFILLMVAVWRYGRIYCNTLCPVGALLGFLSRFSLFKVMISDEDCGLCMQCAGKCKAGCIDADQRIIDHERCIMCFNCLESCHFGALGVMNSWMRPKPRAGDQPDISRRNFVIAAGITLVAATAGTLFRLSGSAGRIAASKLPVAPPGAGRIDRFRDKCISCHLCVSSCPEKIIRPAVLEYGLTGFAQPLLEFKNGTCRLDCATCSNVCPTGALTPLDIKTKSRLQIGQAEFIMARCVVYTKHAFCGACAQTCPTGAVRMKDWEHGLIMPEVDAALCIGCGRCEHICPAKPDKAIVVHGVDVQRPAAKARKNVVKPSMSSGFPF